MRDQGPGAAVKGPGSRLTRQSQVSYRTGMSVAVLSQAQTVFSSRRELPKTLKWERSVFSRMSVTMAIAALSTAGFSQYVAASSNVSASQQAWQSLQQSLASGNLSAAQTAFNAYSQLNQNLSATSGSNSSSSSQLSMDMKALGSAISSGDLSTAQSAFATVQSDMKSTPSQAVTNAESAVNQTVQWMDDLLNLSSMSGTTAAPVDPTTAILDSAYGLNSSSNSNGGNSTDPTTSILDSAYGDTTAGSSTGATGTSSADESSASGTSSSATSSYGYSPVSSGNEGCGASVNVYA